MAIYTKAKDCRPLGQPLPTINHSSFNGRYPLHSDRDPRAVLLEVLERGTQSSPSGEHNLASTLRWHYPERGKVFATVFTKM